MLSLALASSSSQCKALRRISDCFLDGDLLAIEVNVIAPCLYEIGFVASTSEWFEGGAELEGADCCGG